MPRRGWVGLSPLAVGAAGVVVGFAGSWVPYGWTDEAATVSAATRTVPQLLELVTGRADAVHGLYYLVMHAWASIFGSGMLALRIPSALAVGAAAAGLFLIGRTLGSEKFAWLAAAVFLTVPMVLWSATEARSYSWVLAAGTWLTLLLLHALRRADIRWWVAYAAVATAATYLFMYLSLVLVAHLLAVAVTRDLRSNLLRCSAATVAALALASPVVLLAIRQSAQVDWLEPFSLSIFRRIAYQWADDGSRPYALLAWALILIGLFLLFRRPPAALQLAAQFRWLILLWLAFPTAALVLATALYKPLYLERYTLVSLPAAALLVAVTAVSVKRWAALPVLVLALLAVPSYLQQRTPTAKGVDWGATAAQVAGASSPGEAIYFADESAAKAPRQMLTLYGNDFKGLRDIALAASASRAGLLWDQTRSADQAAGAVAAARTRSVLIVAEVTPTPEERTELEAFARLGFHPHTMYVGQYTRVLKLEAG